MSDVYVFDFFLQAHHGLQDTVGYMFVPMTKAVSLVGPVCYADLACERRRCYIHKLTTAVENGTGSGTAGREEAVMRSV